MIYLIILLFYFADNIILSIDSILFLKINDAYLASYGVEDPEYAISQLVQTTIRLELWNTFEKNLD